MEIIAFQCGRNVNTRLYWYHESLAEDSKEATEGTKTWCKPGAYQPFVRMVRVSPTRSVAVRPGPACGGCSIGTHLPQVWRHLLRKTRKILAMPSIAREAGCQSLLAQQLAQQEESVKRTREEAHAAEKSARKKGKIKETSQPVSSLAIGRVASNDSGRGLSASGSAKLCKGQDSPALDEDGGKKEKKWSGVFALFGRKRDKNKDKHLENVESIRNSEDSGHSGSNHGHYTPSPPETAGPSSMKGSTSSPQSWNHSISDLRCANAGLTPTPG